VLGVADVVLDGPTGVADALLVVVAAVPLLAAVDVLPVPVPVLRM
jgi:hypothetical protein